MKIALVADVHLGNHKRFGGPSTRSLNVRCMQGLGVLERAVKRAEDLSCSSLVGLGDLFDYSHPEPQLLAEVQRVFKDNSELLMDKHLLVGNHDQDSDEQGDHALGPLTHTDAVYAFDQNSALLLNNNRLVVLVPHSAKVPARSRIADALTRLAPATQVRARRYLCMHVGVSDKDTAPWLKGAPDSIAIDDLVWLCKEHDVSKVFAGNWHDHKVWHQDGVDVYQLGALVPTGWDNPGLGKYGCMALLDTDTNEVTFEWIPGPRFLNARGLDELEEVLGQTYDPLLKLYVQATVEQKDLVTAQKYLSRAQEKGRVVAGEARADATDRVVAARSAAGAARSAKTLDEALEGFVAAMPLPEGVGREEVTARCRKFLGA